MKRALQIFLLGIVAISVTAQNTVNIQINHLLDGVQYQNDIVATNDLGNDFKIDRLQYYLSGFSLVHDGGQITEVEDMYVLVSMMQSTDPTMIELGDYTFDNLEAVRFHFGVDEEANHADPSLLHPSHALAPKFPSMHWGWAAGYRFIALEGNSGANVDQELQFHCIGDEFYTLLEYPVSMSGETEYTVQIDAEYGDLMDGIDISGGLILHGSLGQIQVLASNMTQKVFLGSNITSTLDSELVSSLHIYPNPTMDRMINVNLETATSDNMVTVQDALGTLIYSNTQMQSRRIELPVAGMYFLSVSDRTGKILATRKIVAQ